MHTEYTEKTDFHGHDKLMFLLYTKHLRIMSIFWYRRLDRPHYFSDYMCFNICILLKCVYKTHLSVENKNPERV